MGRNMLVSCECRAIYTHDNVKDGAWCGYCYEICGCVPYKSTAYLASKEQIISSGFKPAEYVRCEG